jgi:hypothetical protein
MKCTATFYLFLVATVLCSSHCRKSLDNKGLPAATQEGKNTLGFMLNGQPWGPKGFNGTAKLSVDFDATINNGIVGIVAYRTLSANDKTQFILGITDSLNFKNAPFTLFIKKRSVGALGFSTKDYCDVLHTDTAIYENGKINITKLDRQNHIIAGTFEGVLYKQVCGDTLKITDGRFDIKY